jgi:hypothetical protein
MKIILTVCFLAPLTFLVFGYNLSEPYPRPTQISQVREASPAQPVFIEINQVPPPFDIGGVDPYVIWINGKREKVAPHYIEPIIEKIGRKNIKPIDIPNLHEGWLRPHFFEQPEKEVHLGRTRSLNDRQQSQ